MTDAYRCSLCGAPTTGAALCARCQTKQEQTAHPPFPRSGSVSAGARSPGLARGEPRPGLLAGLLEAEQASALLVRTLDHLSDQAHDPSGPLDVSLLETSVEIARSWHRSLRGVVLWLAGLAHLLDPAATPGRGAVGDDETELEVLAHLVDAVRLSHELTGALAIARDQGRRDDLDAAGGAVALCVELARRLFAATLRIQERVEGARRGG
jgi:hypothetical protein